jgi:hypothetical protein
MPMKNIYNLLSDGFTSMNIIETDYITEIDYIEGFIRTCKINIKSKNPNAIRSSSLSLILDNFGNLLDYYENNDLFIDNIWDRFCLIIEAQITEPDPHATLQQYIMAYANQVPDTAEEDEFET